MNRQAIPEDGEDGGDLVEAAAAWFVRLRDPAADEDERRAFDAWVRGGPERAAAYAQAAALWGELGDMPDPRPRQEPEATPVVDIGRGRRRWRTAPIVGALAASVALVAAFGLWSQRGLEALNADHRTAVGETRTLTLADGTMVDLNTDTALVIDFSSGLRRVALLRGEAFFTVARDPDRPFEVTAEGGTATAVGTAYGVRDSGGAVTVAVTQGRVRVTAPGGGDGVVLAAGETARYGTAGEVAAARADVAAATAWRRGRLVFADRPLGDVVAELDRYRPGAILLLGDAVAGARFTGVFNLRDTDAALSAIDAAPGVGVVHVTPWLTLVRAAD